MILSLLSVEIDMMMTWLAPLDLADREATVLQVREGEFIWGLMEVRLV